MPNFAERVHSDADRRASLELRHAACLLCFRQRGDEQVRNLLHRRAGDSRSLAFLRGVSFGGFEVFEPVLEVGKP